MGIPAELQKVQVGSLSCYSSGTPADYRIAGNQKRARVEILGQERLNLQISDENDVRQYFDNQSEGVELSRSDFNSDSNDVEGWRRKQGLKVIALAESDRRRREEEFEAIGWWDPSSKSYEDLIEPTMSHSNLILRRSTNPSSTQPKNQLY